MKSFVFVILIKMRMGMQFQGKWREEVLYEDLDVQSPSGARPPTNTPTNEQSDEVS